MPLITLLCLLTFLIGQAALAQPLMTHKAKFRAARLAPYLNEGGVISKATAKQELLFQRQGVWHLAGLAQLIDESTIAQEQLSTVGAKIRSTHGDIVSYEVPVAKFEAMCKLKVIKVLDVDAQHQLLDYGALPQFFADSVYYKNQFSKLDGTGVLIGVIDQGFDFTHPNFLDGTGSRRRIIAHWEQRRGGTGPVGFSYGYGEGSTNAQEVLSRVHDSWANYSSHATHVTGVAAGSGYFTNNPVMRGFAPNADIIGVSSELTDSQVADAVDFISRLAQQIGKAVVINMSFGSFSDVRDGTSLLDQVMARQVRNTQGKSLVGAMGNEGNYKQHYRRVAGQGLDTLKVLGRNNASSPAAVGVLQLQVWGDTLQPFSVRSSIIDSFGVVQWQGPWFSNTRTINDTVRQVIPGGDTVTLYSFIDSSYATNRRKAANVYADMTKSRKHWVKYEVLSPNYPSDMHLISGLWVMGNELASVSRRFSGFVVGDSIMSLRSPTGTSRHVISVGATTVRSGYRNVLGDSIFANPEDRVIGKIASFSSRGPTMDGRIKPDLVAGGHPIISGFSSFESFPDYYTRLKFNWNNREYRFAGQSGTSMSAPMVAGAIAMMFQVNPTLTWEQVMWMLKDNSYLDTFTGNITKGPNGGSINYGWGKLHALNSINAIPNSVTSTSQSQLVVRGGLYPNPANQFVKLIGEQWRNIPSVLAINAQGINTQLDVTDGQVNLTALKPGFYQIKAVNGALIGRLLKD